MDNTTMLTYITETPNQVELNIKRSKELTKPLVDLCKGRKINTVWLIACGSSSNASNCARPFMMKYLDCDVKVVAPNSFVYFENNVKKDDLAFVISQTGCSTNSIDALKKLKEIGVLAIGVTGNAESDFKDYADLLIDYGVGIETVGYVTKGVTTLALFLILFALETSLANEVITVAQYDEVMAELALCPERHKVIQENTWKFYNENKKDLTSMTVLYSLGFAQGYGVSTETALKIGETIKIPSFAYEAEEYIHGPNLQLTPNYSVIIYDDFAKGSERLYQIYQATNSVTDRTYMVTNNPNVDDKHAIRVPFEIKEPLLAPLYLLPICQIIAFQVSTDLNSWDNHPMFKDFKHYANSKTASVSKFIKED